MKSQRIPEHKLNTTTTAGQVIENIANKRTSEPSAAGSVDTKDTHTNEAK
ncbi:MAG: hypothetical protein ACO1OT_05290 [Heyndrickxia sp.]